MTSLEHEPFVLTLEWECQTCGWKIVMDAPGFAGDGKYHYPRNVACGPLIARRYPYLSIGEKLAVAAGYNLDKEHDGYSERKSELDVSAAELGWDGATTREERERGV